MDLWTEFEGVTIDSAFALNKLLQSEGRSAFFSTFNASGESVLIRIIECHFDEDEILARWRGIQTLGHPNFLRIDRFGKFLIEADDITAVYAVFERVDANLGQVLEAGRLSPAETAQIGLSMASALETLHAHGFVHQHVEARNIYAIGETVKLRSDCIRETPEGEAGAEARRRDVHDLAVVLMQVILGKPRATYPPLQPALPAPFDQIVRNGMSGQWGLAEIQAALVPQKPATPPPPATQSPSATAMPSASAAATQASAPAPAPSASEPARSRPVAASTVSSGQSAPPRSRPERPAFAVSKPAPRTALPRIPGTRFRMPAAAMLSEHHRRWIAAGLFFVVVLFFAWIFTHHFFGHRTATATAPTPAANTATSPAPAPPASAAPAPRAPRHAVPSPSGNTPSHPAAAHGRTDWRVVAFTYNREDQAQKKAASLAQKHPDLQPQAFSPTGKAPWLVTIGGVMQRDAAYALAHKARAQGLPRDTYAQNYSAR